MSHNLNKIEQNFVAALNGWEDSSKGASNSGVSLLVLIESMPKKISVCLLQSGNFNTKTIVNNKGDLVDRN